MKIPTMKIKDCEAWLNEQTEGTFTMGVVMHVDVLTTMGVVNIVCERIRFKM